MEKHFMIDIEATGVTPEKDELLQIGILEVDFDGSRWVPGRSLEITQHTDRAPESEFAKTHMAALYELCNRSPKWAAEDLRWRTLNFFKACGAVPPQVYLMGWNASNFDVPFLIQKGVLVPSSYETGPDGKDQMVGDFHYRIYELGGALSLVCNKYPWVERKKILEMANGFDSGVVLPPGKEHDALYDCYSQVRTLNGLIAMTKGNVRVPPKADEAVAG